ncbi:MAG TPA: hypothetical protein VHC69_30230 [Polyangiaceae bacterium]|nr:hypothetical protein [Polyangiaceae bacterium]
MPWSSNGRGLVAVVLAALSFSCSRFTSNDEPKEDPPFAITMAVLGEDGQGIMGAQVLNGKKVAATTDQTGTAKLTFRGQEGTTVSLTVKCPDTYSSPAKPITFGLRHLDPGSPAPRFEAKCVRQTHSVVVGLKTENGENLPILRLGQVIGKTDELGAAHLMLETSPNEQVTLTLDTSGNELLRPQNPNLTFVSKDKDEMVLLEQKFTVLKKYVPHVVKQRPKPL